MRAPCILLALAWASACAAGPVADGGIFAFTDSQGVVHYSNVPSDGRFQLVIAAPTADRRAGPRESESLQKSAVYSRIITGAAKDTRLEPALVTAVIAAESGGDPRAVSRRGARGLMQLMPATARRYGVLDVFDPEQNIRAGASYLRELGERYQNDLELMLAAYNAGPEAVDRQGGRIPPFRETLDYVPRVLRIYRQLLEPR